MIYSLAHKELYVQDPAYQREGCLDPRATLVPALRRGVTYRNHTDSEMVTSLNGDFRFAYRPEDTIPDFCAVDYDDSGWDTIDVPSMWQYRGYGSPSSAFLISSTLSSAARSPISGFAPAPLPLVICSPMQILVAASDFESAARSVFTAINCTPFMFDEIILFTALFPPPPTPTILISTPDSNSLSSSKAIFVSSFFVLCIFTHFI